MRRLVLVLGGGVGVVVLLAGSLLGYVVWRELRGAGPAVFAPPQNIVELLDRASDSPEVVLSSAAPAQNTTAFPLALPSGVSISVFARDLGGPRVLAEDSRGTLVASIPSQGRVVALPDRDKDGVADAVVDLVTGLDRPHGIAFRCVDGRCQLYVAEVARVWAYEYDAVALAVGGRRSIVALPSGGRHTTRTLLFVGDRLLVSIGSACDACVEDDPRHGTIQVVAADGGMLESYAQGLRNAVFMERHPLTGATWVTEMGRDHLGDNLPPDEINIVEEDRHYGWPYCYGKQVHDSVFDRDGSERTFCTQTQPSYIDLQAHSAPLGLAFFPANSAWPRAWWGDLLVAYHGSWNRSVPTGYKVVRFDLDEQGAYQGREDFISGWLTDDGALGRPVDVLVRSDGVLYLSDDKAGVIYRVWATGGGEPVSRQ